MSPTFRDAQQAIADLLHEHAQGAGPDGDGEFLLSEWVLIANWVDIGDADGSGGELVILGSPHLLRSHHIGLLESAHDMTKR